MDAGAELGAVAVDLDRREAVPGLQGAEPDLAGEARPVAAQRHQLLGGEVRGAAAGGGEPVDELVIAEGALAGATHPAHKARLAIEAVRLSSLSGS